MHQYFGVGVIWRNIAMLSSTRVLFLAMDAGDKFLIQKWAGDGTLPYIGSLLGTGLVGETMSLEGFYEGSTWPSFYTGVTPANHGFHSLTQLNPGTYKFYCCYPGSFIKQEPFWNYLSAAGRRVAILDIPLSGVSRGLNGIQMVEWASHDGVYGFHTWPENLKWEVLARFGRHPVKRSCDSYRRTLNDFRSFRNRLIKGVQKKTELTIHYLKKGDWDFFAQVFSECHCVGHQCWHLHDPHHPSYNPETAYAIGDPIRDVYKAIDAGIGKILASVDKDIIIFFLASHRMAHAFGGYFLLADILKKLNLLTKRPSSAINYKSSSQIRKIYNFLIQSWRKIPETIRTPFEPPLFSLHDWIVDQVNARERPTLPPDVKNVDQNTSKCFPIINGNAVSGIRINLAGREPNGFIQPGREFDNLIQQLSADLLSIIDCETGKPLIKGVKNTSQLYEGEQTDHLPDLLIEWNDDKLLGNINLAEGKGSRLRIFSERFGVLEGINAYVRTGDHRPEGLFIVHGPGIKAIRVERTISIMDFAPTFAKLLGANMPQVDGRPIIEILQMVR